LQRSAAARIGAFLWVRGGRPGNILFGIVQYWTATVSELAQPGVLKGPGRLHERRKLTWHATAAAMTNAPRVTNAPPQNSPRIIGFVTVAAN